MSEESFGTRTKNYIKNLFNFSKYDTKTKLIILVFLGLIVISVIILLYNYIIDPSFLTNIVIRYVVLPIRQLKEIGIAIILGFMIIQGLLVPIPSELVLLAMGIIWGIWGGAIMGIIGSMGAAIICFYISRRGGRPVVENVIGEKNLNMVEDWLEKYGFITILVGRMIPFIPFDIISYGGGFVESIKWRDYLIATLIGSVVRAFFYSFLGDSLIPFQKGLLDVFAPVPIIGPFIIDWIVGGIQNQFNLVLLLLLAGLGGAFLIYQFVVLPLAQKRADKTD